jgi:hypothetical protein
MVKKGAGSSALVRIFVRIGALRRFHALTQKTADLPVEVKWDRRRSDRGDTSAAEGNPAQPDRRQKPPYTWDVADFVVVEELHAEPKVPAKKE